MSQNLPAQLLQTTNKDFLIVIVGMLPLFPDIDFVCQNVACSYMCIDMEFLMLLVGILPLLQDIDFTCQYLACFYRCADVEFLMLIVGILPVCFLDINECAEQRSVCKGIPNSMCQNLPGSYRCACCAGYDPVKSGSDVVSCARNTDREFITL